MTFNPNPPLKFRVIDTQDGSVEDKRVAIISDNPWVFEVFTLSHRFMIEILPDRYIHSASIGRLDSTGAEIYTGDINKDKYGNIAIVMYNKAQLKYMLYVIITDKDMQKYNNWIDFGFPFTTTGNIWQPEYKQYLDKLTQDQPPTGKEKLKWVRKNMAEY